MLTLPSFFKPFKGSIEKHSDTLDEITFYILSANFDGIRNGKFRANHFLHTVLPHCR